MKTIFIVILLFTIALFWAQSLAQDEYEAVTVKSGQVNNGVVMLVVQGDKARFALQCNAEVETCAKLQPGKYAMIRLPEHWGTYDDCWNVEVYATPTPPSPGILGKILGEYCVTEK